MGATASTNVVTNDTNLVTKAFNKCPGVTVSNVVTIDNVTFEPNANCTDSIFEIKQNAGVEADCVIGNLQTSTAEMLADLDAETKGGLGFSASTNVSDLKLEVEQMVENDCNDSSATNLASIKDTTIKSCNLRIVQDATVKQSCMINNLQDTAVKVETTAKATAEGLTLGSFLFGYGGGFMIVIVIVVIVYFVFFKKKKKPTEIPMTTMPMPKMPSTGLPTISPSMVPSANAMAAMSAMANTGLDSVLNSMDAFSGGGESDSLSSELIILILVAIAAVLALSPNKKMCRNDMDILQQKIREANEYVY